MSGRRVPELTRSLFALYEEKMEAIAALGDLASAREDISPAVDRLYQIISDPDYESVDYDLYESAAEALAQHLVNQRAWRDIAALLQMRAAVRSGALSALRSAPAQGREVDPALRALIPALSEATQRYEAERILTEYLEGPSLLDQFGQPLPRPRSERPPEH